MKRFWGKPVWPLKKKQEMIESIEHRKTGVDASGNTAAGGETTLPVEVYASFQSLAQARLLSSFNRFVEGHTQGNFFQSSQFFSFAEQVAEFKPILLLLRDGQRQIVGSLLGIFQVNGIGLKAWFSRRLIVWGGPLVAAGSAPWQSQVASSLLEEIAAQARGKAIYIEFRNLFDCSGLHNAFIDCSFTFRPHLNYLVKLDTGQGPSHQMSQNRVRQVNSSLKLGAQVVEAHDEREVRGFYRILQQLYRHKVRKPLPGIDFFLHFWHSSLGKLFVVKYNGEVMGGIVCPVFGHKVIYECYICGRDGEVKGLYPSVLATWAPIAYGKAQGFAYFDFLGAGRPDVDYGVRDFKARFGGVEVCFGRYELIINQPLFNFGKFVISLYQKIK
jgi:serine/alanine adding enzyme